MTLKLTRPEKRHIAKRREQQKKKRQERRERKKREAAEERAEEAREALMSETAAAIAGLMERIPAEDVEEVLKVATVLIKDREDVRALRERERRQEGPYEPQMSREEELWRARNGLADSYDDPCR